ncbi:FG-GAP-like repeat-containing protein [Stieleria varia]|uniref:FG-GAP repeat protein n=1 Tax=Stieleria varia TaxID=2528005 RepID=A0A5C6B9S4_9BACT|nr:FG-GAP-like repeat-containing protein [Stieleria varia]TWU08069.1 FG-GAP repeat protein [Stieleria varia]
MFQKGPAVSIGFSQRLRAMAGCACDLHHRLCCISLVLLITVGCGRTDSSVVADGGSEETDRVAEVQSTTDRLKKASELLESGKLDDAMREVQQVMLAEPENQEATLIAARIEGAGGNHLTAAEVAASVPLESRVGRQAMEFRLQQLTLGGATIEAIETVLAALEKEPSEIRWRHLAWALLNRHGRREEASWQAEYLCRNGQATDQELLSLVSRADSFPPQLAKDADPRKVFADGLGMARWHFTQLDHRAAIEELDLQWQGEFESASACALYGRLLAETQQFEKIPQWFSRCDEEAKKLGDYWVALGTYFFDLREYEASARAFLEAAVRNPTDRVCMQRLNKVFAALDRADDAEQFRYRGIQLSNSQRSSEALLKKPRDLAVRQGLTREVMELGRPFETLAWTLTMIPRQAAGQRNQVLQQRAALAQNPEALVMASESSLIGVDPKQFGLDGALAKLSDASGALQAAAPVVAREPLAKPRLVNVAHAVGLDFQWYPDKELDVSSIPIHESVGGGIAVVDFDLDGWPDIHLPQGSGEPPSSQCTRSDVLFRNQDARFRDVTEVAGAAGFDYGSGVTAGDVNQDGFADLYVGSLGHNRLLINNGDGTFRDATESLGQVDDRFTSSLAIADINHDGMPDLFESVYIEMEGAFKLPDVGPDGREEQPSPLKHYAQSDRWYESSGEGRFQVHEIDREIAKPGTSLGLLVTDFDGDGRNDVFVGNDVRPNHFLIQNDEGSFHNVADLEGVSNGYSGAANGCMGITHGDFNRDGRIDLHITNFSQESANLFMQSPSGGFTDMAARYGIDLVSIPYVGFGTKAIDVDRNGCLDLLVTNGHIFDMRFIGEGFQMPPQFLHGRGDRFDPATVEDESGYWSGAYLGRSMATTDFNRDGAVDVLIGHLDQPLALLENRTETPGHWIQLELVGVQSERDAIGARVVVSTKRGSFSNWVSAGDGYFCNDESVIDVGLGQENAIQQLEIVWPSGKRQVFASPQIDRRYLSIENDDRLYPR